MNNDDKFIWYVFGVITGMIILGSFLFIIGQNIPQSIESKKLINPIINVKTSCEDGNCITDTTYVYRYEN